ncbi:hypothetical protein SLS61_003821 [Didymella pomorum]
MTHPPTNMNGSFETVTAQQNDNKASGNTTDTVDEQQHAPPIDDRLQALYNTYHTSYAFPISPHSSHKQHASDLAAALLQRHYPLPQYRVERCALGPITKYGINFMLKDDDEPDSDIDLPKVKKAKTSANKKRTANVDPTWHIINHENMSAFVVKKGAVEVVDGIRQTLVWRPCTYLVIVLDDLSTFPRWSRDTLNHRGDVLSDLSGVVGGMQRGHASLLTTHPSTPAHPAVASITNPALLLVPHHVDARIDAAMNTSFAPYRTMMRSISAQSAGVVGVEAKEKREKPVRGEKMYVRPKPKKIVPKKVDR